MKQTTCRIRCVNALVLAGVIATTLAACSADPGATPTTEPTTAESTSPIDRFLTPTESVPPTAYPSATNSEQVANNVVSWYESGGEEQITGVRDRSKEIYSHHAEDNWSIDFSLFFDRSKEAQEYPPIPDRKTQAAWSTALKHVRSGASDIYMSNQLGIVRGSKEVKREAHGWKELAQGVKGLKAIEARLHREFGLDPLTSP
ncbi:hypothetical protein [Streptomyces sp. NPDC048436]|uniref:hypothetical protein n=1 Tax=Streptomyces sp. NPDC048436 TaxID=3365550 RepID=UPI00371460A9